MNAVFALKLIQIPSHESGIAYHVICKRKVEEPDNLLFGKRPDREIDAAGNRG